MPAEVELKFAVSPAALSAVTRLPLLRPLASGKARKTKLASVYFDTPGCKLRKHGLALRIRKQGRKHLQTLKSAGNGGGSALVRGEWEREIGGDRPDVSSAKDTPLADLLTPKSIGALRPVFETVVERKLIPLCIGGTQVELAIDHGWVRSGRRRQSIDEIELELKRGDLTELVKLASELVEAVPATLEVRSKAERGYALGSNEWHEPVRADEIHLDPAGNVGNAFRTIGFSCLHHLAANRNAVLKGVPEGIHQMRIGARRLRAAISAFKEMLEGSETEHIKSELKWLTDELAPARDFDVLLSDVLLPLRDTEAGAPSVDLLISDMQRRRDEGLKAAKAALRTARYRKCILRTAFWLADGAWSRSEDPLVRAWRDSPVKQFAGEVLSHSSEKICKKGKKLQQLDQRHRHKLRIATKKLRYATEFFATLFPGQKTKKTRKRFEGALKALQNSLGKLNDMAVHEKLAHALAGSGLQAEERTQEAYAMGLVIGREQEKARPCIAAAERAIKRLAGSKAYWH